MSCANERDVTVELPWVDFEFAPYSVRLRLDQQKFAYCDVQADATVGDEMQPHIEDGALSELQPAVVKFDGFPIQTLLYRPDLVEIGPEMTTFELRSVLQALDRGEISTTYERVSLERVVGEILDRQVPGYNDNELVSEYGFLNPDNPNFEEQITESFATLSFPILTTEGVKRLPLPGHDTGFINDIIADGYSFFGGEQGGFDFNDVTPLEALRKVAEQFGVSLWISSDGKLLVGQREVAERLHFAAVDDYRVWHLTDYSVTQPRQPIEAVVVKGAAQATTEISEYAERLDLDSDEGDILLSRWGIAYRPGVNDGRIITRQSDSLLYNPEPKARRLLIKRSKEQNTGTVSIDVSQAGTEFSHPQSAKPGDFLFIAAPDESHPCNHDRIETDLYLISGVTHDYSTASGWDVTLDVTKYPALPIETSFRLYSPSENEFMRANEVYTAPGDLE